jgi:hypothetical protein
MGFQALINDMKAATSPGQTGDDEQFEQYLRNQGYINVRRFEDGWAGITRMMFTWALCTELDMTGYGRRYCYTSEAQAVAQLDKMQSLDDVPEGWERRLPEPNFFTIVGFHERHSHVGQVMTEREIIEQANVYTIAQCHKIALRRPQATTVREAVAMLNTDGGVLEAFNVADQAQAFIARAEFLGLGEEARALAARVRR